MNTKKKRPFKNGYTFDDYQAIHDALQAAFASVQAPIMDLIAAQTQDPYKILVGTILSARTLDQTTAGALERLFPIAPDLKGLAQCSLDAIEKAIYPVGFYHDKARHLKALPEAINTLFHGEIPSTVEELIQLPGVGRKTANLVVALAFKKPAICVDTHVHRINNRLAIVKTKTPLETEMALRQCLPETFWIAWNAIFVSFGQTRCRPLSPRCEGCPIACYCHAKSKQ
jgi:endonuclease III